VTVLASESNFTNKKHRRDFLERNTEAIISYKVTVAAFLDNFYKIQSY
jgi:hypothetical protein